MGAFFTALFTVLGQNIATIISIILGGGVAYCAISPKGRLIVKSAFNWMFSTTANNPKLAAGAFDEKLKQLRAMLREAENVNQEALGELAQVNEEYSKAAENYKRFSEKAVILERRGDHEQAVLMAREASQAKIAMEDYQRKIPEYQAIAEATKTRVNEIQWKISNFEQRKKLAISNMEKGKFEKKVSETLKGLNTSEIDDYIKQIEDNATDAKYKAIGARMSYETSDVKKLKDAEEAASMVDAEVFLQNLLNENND